MKYFTMITTALMTLGTAAMAETYVLDPGHTEVRFAWNHAGLSTQTGEWTSLSGTVDFDPSDIPATKVMVEIDPASLHSGVKALDDDLKSENFFDVANFPKITFVSTSAVQTGADSMRLTGDLSVKGVSTQVVLDVELTFMGEHPLGGFFDYYKGDWVAVEATGTLLRSEVGVGLYAPVTSDAVQLGISAEMRAGGWPD